MWSSHIVIPCIVSSSIFCDSITSYWWNEIWNKETSKQPIYVRESLILITIWCPYIRPAWYCMQNKQKLILLGDFLCQQHPGQLSPFAVWQFLYFGFPLPCQNTWGVKSPDTLYIKSYNIIYYTSKLVVYTEPNLLMTARKLKSNHISLLEIR